MDAAGVLPYFAGIVHDACTPMTPTPTWPGTLFAARMPLRELQAVTDAAPEGA
jgi:hypothetical protein